MSERLLGGTRERRGSCSGGWLRGGGFSLASAFEGLFLFGGGFFGEELAPFELLRGVHGAAAFWGAAVAGAGVVAAVPETVVVGDFVAGGDGAAGDDPDAAVILNGFAVALAAVVDEHGGAETVDDKMSVAESKEVGNWVVDVEGIGEVFGESLAGVLGDALTFADGCGGVAAGGVDSGRANDESQGVGPRQGWAGLSEG